MTELSRKDVIKFVGVVLKICLLISLIVFSGISTASIQTENITDIISSYEENGLKVEEYSLQNCSNLNLLTLKIEKSSIPRLAILNQDGSYKLVKDFNAPDTTEYRNSVLNESSNIIFNENINLRNGEIQFKNAEYKTAKSELLFTQGTQKEDGSIDISNSQVLHCE